ncbi:DUF6838 family protein [Paenibacillus sp. J2TS4]|uniref:phage tail terminator family protein n=1 Tax=Paenibacillus sp. J2TS4 TaxID=2807194 RepID=UPI001B032B7F|nr:hypothetical protein [Paenibacillus sp. J2TS4]GIP35503.1 hypothetical protein J2TS4_47130 [Paenibacillus sp. J2TS4]
MDITWADFVEGAVAAIHERFPDIPIHLEEEGGGEPARPCFIVRLAAARQVKEIDRRYLRTHSLVVEYLPDNVLTNFHEIAEALYDQLEAIQVAGSLCRGSQWSHEIKNGTLYFAADYSMYLLRSEAPSPKMQSFKQEGSIKNG